MRRARLKDFLRKLRNTQPANIACRFTAIPDIASALYFFADVLSFHSYDFGWGFWGYCVNAVSYTHLTLPTIFLV